ncbi:hypothetical protein LCGC14_2102610, partial [marine sediment metagenome]
LQGRQLDLILTLHSHRRPVFLRGPSETLRAAFPSVASGL